jgi:DNA repair protein RadC
MQNHHPTALPAVPSIPQLKVVFCGTVCEAAPRYTNSLQVAEMMSEDVRQLDREAFYVLHLNGKNQIICKELVSVGSLNQTIVHPREVFKGALLNNSAALICVHNHPSGDPGPSSEDRVITKRLVECAMLLGINFLEHLVVSHTDIGVRFYSFKEGGLLSGYSVNGALAPVVRPDRPKCDWLIELRRKAGITQKHLATLSGIKHQAVISMMERGYEKIDEATEKHLRKVLEAAITLTAPKSC